MTTGLSEMPVNKTDPKQPIIDRLTDRMGDLAHWLKTHLVLSVIPVALVVGGYRLHTFRNATLNEGETKDYGQLWPELLVLLVTVAALLIALPTPARLWIARQEGGDHSDLVFSLFPGPSGASPWHMKLDCYVVVANVGGRQGVLSDLRLTGFLPGDRAVGSLYFPAVIATAFTTQRQWVTTIPLLRGSANRIDNLTVLTDTPPPLSLRPDDVLLMRVRHDVELDLKHAVWDLTKLEALGDAIAVPITSIRLKMTYWQSNRSVENIVDLPITTAQQSEYLAALKRATRDFTVRPLTP